MTTTPIQKAIRALTSSEPLSAQERAGIVIELDRLSIRAKTPEILADTLALAECELTKYKQTLGSLLEGWSTDDLSGHAGPMDLPVTGVKVAVALQLLGR